MPIWEACLVWVKLGGGAALLVPVATTLVFRLERSTADSVGVMGEYVGRVGEADLEEGEDEEVRPGAMV